MGVIEIKTINMGGIADSKIMGATNSVAEMVGLDIHGVPGFMKVNQKLTKKSGNLIDDEIKTGIACSNGFTYFFGKNNGKVWQRNSSGTYFLIGSTSPSLGANGITGSMEYQGYIYYAMEKRLGRWQIGTSFATRDDNYATFKNGNLLYHPMKVLNLVLYIGDGNFVTQVDSSLDTITYNTLTGTFQGGDRITGGTSGATATVLFDDGVGQMQVEDVIGVFQVGETITGAPSGATAVILTNVNSVFSDKALDLPRGYIITSFGQLGTDLLIGTTISNNVIGTQVFRWNTWSVSFTNSDPIPEIGINCFLATDNFVIVNAGKKGNLYIYNGSTLDLYKRIPGNWDANNTAIVNPEATLNFNGIPLFCLSFDSGNPTTLGIYSLARTNRNYPYVLNCEYVLSETDISNIYIGTIIGMADIFLVSYRDNAGNFGIMELDLSLKYEHAFLTSRLIMPDRMKLSNFSEIFCGYQQLPTGCDLKFENSTNYGAFVPVPDDEMSDDIDRKMKYMQKDIGEATALQVKVKFQVKDNDAPIVDMIHVVIKDFRQARPSPDATKS